MSSPLFDSPAHTERFRTSEDPLDGPARLAHDAPSPSLPPSRSPESRAAFESLCEGMERLFAAALKILRKVEQEELTRWMTEWSWFDPDTRRNYSFVDLEELRELAHAQKPLAAHQPRDLRDLIDRVECAYYADKTEKARKLREKSARGFVEAYRQHFRDIGFLNDADYAIACREADDMLDAEFGPADVAQPPR